MAKGTKSTVTPLQGGFLNTVLADARTVIKRYVGANAADRRRLEHDLLRSLADQFEVPSVLPGGDERTLLLELADGENGQQLIREGHAEIVLKLCGTALRRLQVLDARSKAGILRGSGPVIVHGDFGPQNVLISRTDAKVTAVLDWEFSHLGDPIEDLAWAEWIIRRHHKSALQFIPALFSGYGTTPHWRTRKKAMVEAINRMTSFAVENNGARDLALWDERLKEVLAWDEHDFRYAKGSLRQDAGI
jgi:aminoglycoside phosphotransferase (APT) family kinase protein